MKCAIEAVRFAAQGSRSGFGADCAYFFLFDGWKDQLRSNRWHWIRRWSSRLPVIIVQTARNKKRGSIEAESRIPNAQVLHVDDPRQQGGDLECLTTIKKTMRKLGHAAPLFWMYDPAYVLAFAGLPAAGRIYHATENYFNFAHSLPETFLRYLRTSVEASDLTITVSAGVAESIRKEVPGSKICIVTNGCDYGTYSRGAPLAMLQAAAAPFGAVAVYAGNINLRLDFKLISAVSRAHPRVLFAFFGPVSSLSGRDSQIWQTLLQRHNVKHLGVLDADLLPDVYAAADVGLIPYKKESYLVDNGFPLKTLEMAAARLPVVATPMRSIEGLSRGIAVTNSHEEFIAKVATMQRRLLPGDIAEELSAVAQANDYDRKFEQALAQIVAEIPACMPNRTRLDLLAARGLFDLADAVGELSPGLVQRARALYRGASTQRTAKAILRKIAGR